MHNTTRSSEIAVKTENQMAQFRVEVARIRNPEEHIGRATERPVLAFVRGVACGAWRRTAVFSSGAISLTRCGRDVEADDRIA
jgi:hypothetical protein